MKKLIIKTLVYFDRGAPKLTQESKKARMATTEMLLSDSLGFLDELPALMASIDTKFNSIDHPHILEKSSKLHLEAKDSIEAWNVTLEENILDPPISWDPAHFYPSIPPRPLRLLRALDTHSEFMLQVNDENDRIAHIIAGKNDNWNSFKDADPDLLELCLYLDTTHSDFTEFLRRACFSPDINLIRVFMNDGRCDLQAVYDRMRGMSAFYVIRRPGLHATVLEMFEKRGCVRPVMIRHFTQRYATTGN